MTDDEMVKLAAKATGYVVFQERDMGGALIGYKVQLQDQTCYWWDPLNDDGDALRLAFELRMVVGSGTVTVDTDAHYDIIERYDESDVASLRFAIVRAAAEIGCALAAQEEA